MSFASDDLASVMVAPDREFVGFAQGIIRQWDPSTFANVVRVRGSDLSDLPVASGVEALTYRPGNVVTLTKWRPGSGSGAAQYWIGNSGRVIIPGPDAAEEAIAPMRTSLAQQIAAEVLADRIHIGFLAGVGTRHSTNYGDLTPISVPGPGPSVTADVTSGSAIVMLSCRMDAHLGTGTSNTGFMSFEVSGATSIAAQDGGYELGLSGPDSAGVGVGPISASRVRAIAGLNPGENTFTAKFRTGSDSTSAVTFSSLEIVVIAL